MTSDHLQSHEAWPCVRSLGRMHIAQRDMCHSDPSPYLWWPRFGGHRQPVWDDFRFVPSRDTLGYFSLYGTLADTEGQEGDFFVTRLVKCNVYVAGSYVEVVPHVVYYTYQEINVFLIFILEFRSTPLGYRTQWITSTLQIVILIRLTTAAWAS